MDCDRCEQGTGRCNQSHVLGEDEYIVDASAFDETFQTFLMDELVVSSANVLSTVSTNYDLWDGQIRVSGMTISAFILVA